MKLLLKTTISLSLSFLLLMITLHADKSNHNLFSGEKSLCNIDCHNTTHHSIVHECEKCLIQNNKTIIQSFSKLLYKENHVELFSRASIHDNLFFNLTLYGRAPPSLL